MTLSGHGSSRSAAALPSIARNATASRPRYGRSSRGQASCLTTGAGRGARRSREAGRVRTHARMMGWSPGRRQSLDSAAAATAASALELPEPGVAAREAFRAHLQLGVIREPRGVVRVALLGDTPISLFEA